MTSLTLAYLKERLFNSINLSHTFIESKDIEQLRIQQDEESIDWYEINLNYKEKWDKLSPDIDLIDLAKLKPKELHEKHSLVLHTLNQFFKKNTLKKSSSPTYAAKQITQHCKDWKDYIPLKTSAHFQLQLFRAFLNQSQQADLKKNTN